MANNNILCIGGAHLDWIAHYPADSFPAVDIPVLFKRSFGGVAHNIAQHLNDLGHDVALMSAIGGDVEGELITSEVNAAGFVDHLVIKMVNQKTASILFVTNQQGKHLFMQPRTEIYDVISPAYIESKLLQMNQFATWVIDTNFPTETIAFLADVKPKHIKLYGVIACPPKSQRIIPVLPYLDALFVNQLETALILGDDVKTDEKALLAAAELRKKGGRQVFITLGEHGACASAEDFHGILPIIKAVSVDTTGAGDAFAASAISGLVQQKPTQECLQLGLAAASLAVEVSGKTYGMLSNKKIEQRGKINE
ncbi:MAG: PfkB family carbohydrate kinase [Gammaproteobacteria bacterium]